MTMMMRRDHDVDDHEGGCCQSAKVKVKVFWQSVTKVKVKVIWQSVVKVIVMAICCHSEHARLACFTPL